MNPCSVLPVGIFDFSIVGIVFDILDYFTGETGAIIDDGVDGEGNSSDDRSLVLGSGEDTEASPGIIYSLLIFCFYFRMFTLSIMVFLSIFLFSLLYFQIFFVRLISRFCR